MKKADISDSNAVQDDDMLPEYRFDYRTARPNRFAAGVVEGSLVVVLEPEIAQVFKSQETVKAILHAIAGAIPKAKEHTAVGS